MINRTLLPLLEKSLSRYLALDPETLKRLSHLSGKAIKIELTDWQMDFYLLPHAKGVQIKTAATIKPNATIKGSSLELLRLRFANEKSALQLAKKLAITGDVQLAQVFQHILQQLEIDWEEPLSKLTGDILAHQIGAMARGLKGWGAQIKRNLGLNITEYLQEEKQLLPSHQAMEDFFDEISRLQQDTERLEAKLKNKSHPTRSSII
jgi:ubiquinone biosynthesis protein UbiJ